MNNLWLAIKIFFGRLGSYLYFKTGYYGAWSRFYRWIYEQKFKTVPLENYDSYRSLADGTGHLYWKADSWKEMWDAISTPQKVQFIKNDPANKDKYIGDCDEFAIYNIATLNQSLARGVFTSDPNFKLAQLLTITWVDSSGGFGGHNVALLIRTVNGKNSYAFMDYSTPSLFRDTIREVVQDVLNMYSGSGTLLAYGVQTESLHNISAVWGP